MAYSSIPPQSNSIGRVATLPDPVPSHRLRAKPDTSNSAASGGATPGNSDNSALDSILLQFALDMLSMMDTSDETDNSAIPGIPLMPYMSAASTASANSSAPGGAVQHGSLNVVPAGSGNPAGIAEGELHKSAASIELDQSVPMHRGVDTTVCCANFASACLEQSGEIPVLQHTDSVRTLHNELGQDGWHDEARAQAKPGDVCIVGRDEHVEIVASNDNGRVTLVGSNNTEGGSGPQVVSYDTYTGNRNDVTFLSK